MLGVVVNEKNIINEVLNREKSKDDIGKNISLMIKYYYITEKITDKQELKEKIFNLLKEKYEGYKRGKWETTVERSVSLFLKNAKFKKEYKVGDKIEEFFPNKEFINVEKVEITNSELNCIKQLEDKNLEKISFIMLVYAKITNKVLRENLDWVGQSISNILKEAKVNLKGTDKELLLHRLYNTKLRDVRLVDEETGEYTEEVINYISMPKSSSKNSFKLNYTDTTNENNNTGITIEDFDSVIYYYLTWKGEKWKKCVICGKWIKLNGVKDNSKKYCSICAKEQKTIKTIENRELLKSKESL